MLKSINLIFLVAVLFSFSAESYQVSLDVHIHDQESSADNLSEQRINYLLKDESKIKHGFLLSYSFNWPVPDGSERRKVEKIIKDDMLHTSQLVSKNPKQLSGLCGIRLDWKNLNELTRYCLKLPHMVGLKIRAENGVPGIAQYKKDKVRKRASPQGNIHKRTSC